MADLGNQKIKDTYQLVLQTDTSGNLQNLTGGTPSLVFNSAFTYNVGSLVDGYVLTSNASGVASWNAVAFSGDIYVSGGTINGTTIELNASSGGTISIPGLKWSANTDGSISPSGATTDVRVSGDTYVAGNISGTTDLHIDGTSTLGSVGISGQYISVHGGSSGGGDRIFLQTSPNTSNPSYLLDNWGIQDNDHFYFGTDEDLDVYHTGSHGYIDNDTGSLYVKSATLYLGDTTSETTVQDNLTVNDNLSVGDDLTVNTNTLYVNSTGNTVGIGTINQDATLTVSGESGTTWTAWEDGGMTSISFTNGIDFLRYEDNGITVPDPLQDSGTSVRVLVGGVYYYGTTTGVNFVNGRGYFGLTWSQANITITSGLADVISYGGTDAEQKIFKVYNGTNPVFQISGTTVMSGSTDLLDIFTTTATTINGGTF